MIEITNPWNRVPFHFGPDNQWYENSGLNNVGIINPYLTNLKADCPCNPSAGGSGGYGAIYLWGYEHAYIGYQVVDTPRFQAKVVEGDYANAPWIGTTMTLACQIQTDTNSYIGGVWSTTTTYSTLNYSYTFSGANYNPDPMDANYTSPRTYELPYSSTPPGPSFVSYDYIDYGGGDFSVIYGYPITSWDVISVSPGIFEAG